LTLISSAFEDQGRMPLAFAQRTFDTPQGWPVYCPGENVSPPLNWSNVPPDTESLALTVYDHITLCEECRELAPEGRVWGHWGVYNISVATTGLDEGLPADLALPGGSIQVVNGYNEIGYGGPCPPLGHVHVYVFTLYALDTELDLPEGAGIEDLSAALDGHVLAQAELGGVFRGR
jgi:Raf kinase inhibitor-like YbhB/YbcL family protein